MVTSPPGPGGDLLTKTYVTPTRRGAYLSPRESRGLGAGWPRSRAELSRRCGSRLWGPRHGRGSQPTRPASPRHGRHAQAREATQVPGARRLFWPRWARGRGVGRLRWRRVRAGRARRREGPGSGPAGTTRRSPRPLRGWCSFQ